MRLGLLLYRDRKWLYCLTTEGVIGKDGCETSLEQCRQNIDIYKNSDHELNHNFICQLS